MQAISRLISRIPAILSIALLGSVGATGQAGLTAQPDTIAVTYIGNEGFLLEAAGRKVLFDALYREGVSGYVVHPAERRQAMEQASPPFDGVGLVLATHDHADHFDPGAVAAHLRHDAGAAFLSTTRAAQRLQEEIGGEPSMGERIVGVFPDEGERFRMTVNGIEVQAINLHHGRTRPIQNLGFLVTIGGWTVLHVGDTEATSDDFELYEFAADDIDIAFIPYWFLIADERDDDLRRVIPAKRIVVMHIPPRNVRAQHIEQRGGWDAMLGRIEKQYPAAVIFREPMQTRSFPRSSN